MNMSNPTLNNKRIAKNTILLYFRMILLMAVSLYTSRVVLATLGVEDYGIYNVVGGFIGMLAFLNGAMSGSSQRFITVALGKGDKQYLNKVFSTCLCTHAIIALIVFIIAETIGLWFLIEKLVIPDGRMTAAMIVYQCSVITSIVQIMSYPYNAAIIAHEEMSAFAYISIYEALANLGIAFLIKIGTYDRLSLYALALLLVKVSVIFVYRIYCKRHYFKESIKRVFDKVLVKEMFSFTGWNLWGGLAGTLMGQGVNILLNLFFGPLVNAARGLSVQVQSAVNMFATNFQMAINPQIMKTYASGEMNAMYTLIYRSAKFTFILLLCIIMPLVVEVDTVLTIWLGNFPKYTDIFVRLTLVTCLIDSISNPFMTASAATGKVKLYQSVVGGILLLIVPIAYIALRLGATPASVYIVHIFIGIIAFVARLLIVRGLINLSIKDYFGNVIFPCLKVLCSSILIVVFINIIPSSTVWIALVKIVIICLVVLISSSVFGLSKSERSFIIDKIKTIKQKTSH